jgi:hypothetical protein
MRVLRLQGRTQATQYWRGLPTDTTHTNGAVGAVEEADDLVVVTGASDGSAVGRRRFIVWNPPVLAPPRADGPAVTLGGGSGEGGGGGGGEGEGGGGKDSAVRRPRRWPAADRAAVVAVSGKRHRRAEGPIGGADGDGGGDADGSSDGGGSDNGSSDGGSGTNKGDGAVRRPRRRDAASAAVGGKRRRRAGDVISGTDEGSGEDTSIAAAWDDDAVAALGRDEVDLARDMGELPREQVPPAGDEDSMFAASTRALAAGLPAAALLPAPSADVIAFTEPEGADEVGTLMIRPNDYGLAGCGGGGGGGRAGYMAPPTERASRGKRAAGAPLPTPVPSSRDIRMPVTGWAKPSNYRRTASSGPYITPSVGHDAAAEPGATSGDDGDRSASPPPRPLPKWVQRWRNHAGPDAAKRRSALIEASYLLAHMVMGGLRTIAFCRVRKVAELLLQYTHERLAAAATEMAALARPGGGGGGGGGVGGVAGLSPLSLIPRVKSYRAGYLKEHRRAIEKE